MSDRDPAPAPASHGKGRGVLSLFDRFRSRPATADEQAPEPPTAATGELVSQARAFQDLRVDDVMKPRADIVAIDRSCGFAEVVARFVEAEHSRMPVYRETLDDPVGVVHVKDVFKLLARKTRKPRPTDQVLSGRHNLVRQVLYVPASMRASELLGQMRAEQTHMALVIDEFGGTDGLVTLEDLLETLVGEISDEHDEAVHGAPIVPDGDGWLVDGRAPLEDLETAIGEGVDLAPPDLDEEIDTVAGLVNALAGRVPQRREVVDHPGGFVIEVLSADARLRPRVAWQRGWSGRALALIAGLAAGFAQPPFGILPGLLGYALLLALLDAEGPRPLRSAALRGWLGGVGYFAVGTWWIVEPFMVDAKQQGWMAPFALVLLSGGLALFWAAAALVYRAAKVRGAAGALVFAGCLGGFEWLRGHILTGFPWDLPGETWRAGSAPSQAAALVGAYGLTWITVAVAAAPAVLTQPWSRRHKAGVLAVALAALAGVYAYGFLRLEGAKRPAPSAPLIRVVQADIDQKNKWRPENLGLVFDTYVSLTDHRGPAQPAIVIWPEGALPAVIDDLIAPGSPYAARLRDAIAPGQTLLMGANRAERGPDGAIRYFNSLVAFRREAEGLRVTGVYDKHHLVPFGEYMPAAELATKVGFRALVHMPDDFSAGPRSQPIAPWGVPPVQVLICYEALFPGVTRGGAALSGLRPAWILNISNDAWFGQGSGPLQHLNIASYRAIEEGLPIVRATPTGVSALIDAYGRVAPGARLALGGLGVIDAPLPPALKPTAFDAFGDAGFAALLLLSGLSTLAYRVQRPKTPV
jgi:apolipoprotein N-acyltransferase